MWYHIAMQYDFLAVGDTVIDAFIRLKEASGTCDEHGEHCKICIAYGQKVPYEKAYVLPAVGNAPNAAVSAARLGLNSAILSSVGNDENGQKCLASFKKDNVSTEFISAYNDIPTNYHYVLWYEDDRTILIKHEEFPYVLQDVGSPKWVYWSSLRQGSQEFHDQFIAYLAAHPEVNFAFQPGVFEIRMGVPALRGMYERAGVFFCNKEEAQMILSSESHDIKELLSGIRALGPQIAVITDGKRGAYAMDEHGAWFMPPYPDIAPPFERTGAGDAFSSTFTAALALGMTTAEALRWAPINSMSVVQKVGAQEGLLTREQLEAYLAAAPADYAPTPLP